MRLLIIELRRSSLRWFLPLLIAVDLAAMFGRNSYWIGVWPQASAAVQLPSLYLGPALAASAAWAAGRHGGKQLGVIAGAGARPIWQTDVAVLASTLLYGFAAYLVGAATAAVVTVGSAGPGFLWPSYLLLGMTVLVICASFGHALARLLNVKFLAPVVAAIASFLALKTFGDPLGLLVFYGDPQLAISSRALLLRIALALFIAMSCVGVTSLVLRNGWRPPPKIVALGVSAFLASALVVVILPQAGRLVVERPAPKDPLCSMSTPKVCVWPEDRKYLPHLSLMAERLSRIPGEMFSVPAAFYERGLRGTSQDEVYYRDFQIIDGYLWSAADAMAGEVLDSAVAPYYCPAASEAEENRRTLAVWEIKVWLKSRATAAARPSLIRGGPPVDYSAIGHLITRPESEQQAWARERFDIIKGTRCA